MTVQRYELFNGGPSLLNINGEWLAPLQTKPMILSVKQAEQIAAQYPHVKFKEA
ncbi:MAG: hypothetical protein ACRCYB_12725 [Aeromonas veronii]